MKVIVALPNQEPESTEHILQQSPQCQPSTCHSQASQQRQSSLEVSFVLNALQMFPDTEAGKKAQYSLAYNLGMASSGHDSQIIQGCGQCWPFLS